MDVGAPQATQMPGYCGCRGNVRASSMRIIAQFEKSSMSPSELALHAPITFWRAALLLMTNLPQPVLLPRRAPCLLLLWRQGRLLLLHRRHSRSHGRHEADQ